MRILLQLSNYNTTPKWPKSPLSPARRAVLRVLSLSASRDRAPSRRSTHQHRQTGHITQPRTAVSNGGGSTEGRTSHHASRAALWFCASSSLASIIIDRYLPCLISRLISRRLLLLLNPPKELAKVQNLGPSRRGTLPSVVFINFRVNMAHGQ